MNRLLKRLRHLRLVLSLSSQDVEVAADSLRNGVEDMVERGASRRAPDVVEMLDLADRLAP